MAQYHDVETSYRLLGKLGHGLDLLEELTAICAGQNLQLGRVEALGALQRATVGFYDQTQRVYESLTFDEGLEILSLIGNVSMKDGAPMVHAHVTLARHDGSVIGGHLMPGCIIFACEFILQAFQGPPYNRGHDAATGLPLWEM